MGAVKNHFHDEICARADAMDDGLRGEIVAETKCVNAHDRCFLGGPCPYCEITGYRDEHGRFASALA